jgi:hypothetical protein
MKYTTLLIVALLATSAIAQSEAAISQVRITGCTNGKCVNCGGSGCLLCGVGTYPMSATAGANKACVARKDADAGCSMMSDDGVCTACEKTHHYVGGKCYLAGDGATTTVYAKGTADAICMATSLDVSTVATAVATCTLCAGITKPAAAPARNVAPTCTAQTSTTGVVGCAYHSAEVTCEVCTGSKSVSANKGDCLTAWGVNTMGCLDSTCSKCNWYQNYWAVAVVTPRCALGFSNILSAAGMIVALFLANF